MKTFLNARALGMLPTKESTKPKPAPRNPKNPKSTKNPQNSKNPGTRKMMKILKEVCGFQKQVPVSIH